MTTNKLYRSRDERMLGGVAGGLGEYLDLDPTLIRLAFVFSTLYFGLGLLPYLILWIVVPREPEASLAAPVSVGGAPAGERPSTAAQ